MNEFDRNELAERDMSTGPNGSHSALAQEPLDSVLARHDEARQIRKRKLCHEGGRAWEHG
jgi:hypothetical protein